jgi:hypothetical protein
MLEVAQFAGSPGRLRATSVVGGSVSRNLYQLQDAGAKALGKQAGADFSGLVLKGIVKKGGNCFVLVAAILLDKGANAEQVG